MTAESTRNRVRPLKGRCLLVVEDDFFIGLELMANLESLGADVVGPCATVAAARATLRDREINGAVLDFNLGAETSAELAEDLISRGVPVIFATAYADRPALFEGSLSEVERLGKPVSPAILQRAALRAFGDA